MVFGDLINIFEVSAAFNLAVQFSWFKELNKKWLHDDVDEDLENIAKSKKLQNGDPSLKEELESIITKLEKIESRFEKFVDYTIWGSRFFCFVSLVLLFCASFYGDLNLQNHVWHAKIFCLIMMFYFALAWAFLYWKRDTKGKIELDKAIKNLYAKPI